MSTPTQAINQYMERLLPYLDNPGVTELCINENGATFVEEKASWTEIEPLYSHTDLGLLSKVIANFNSDYIDHTKPMLSGTIPSGDRVQIVLPPVVDSDTPIFCFRKRSEIERSLEDYEEDGWFRALESRHQQEHPQEVLKAFYQKKDFKALLRYAVLHKRNIVLSGGTSSGKTTLFKTLLHDIPANERIISIEDTREITIPQPNRLHLVAPRTLDDHPALSFTHLLEASLRLRPDRIMAAELRGAETFSYLRAINTGHPGSITTIHADSCDAVFTQIQMMLSQAGLTWPVEHIVRYARSVIHVVVQLGQVNGQRFCDDIWIQPAS